MVGTAVVVGFFAGVLEHRRGVGVYPYYPPSTHGADVMPPKEKGGQGDLSPGVYPFYGRERPRTAQRVSRPAFSEMQGAKQRMAGIWSPLRGIWEEVVGELAHERNRLQKTALHAGRLFIHDAVRIFGELLLDQLARSGSSWQHQGRRR